MSIVIITPAASEPVTLAEAKLYARADASTAEDSLFTIWIAAARKIVEQSLQRSILTRTLEKRLDVFPGNDGVIPLEFGPVQALVSVKYVDVNGALQTIDPAQYQLDANSERAQLIPAFNLLWPAVQGGIDDVRIQYKAGYADDEAHLTSEQAPIKAHLLALITSMYDNRGSDSEKPASRNDFIDRLLDPFSEVRL